MEAIDKITLKVIYRHIDNALDEIERGDTKRGIVTLRQILPKGYKHTFERSKREV